ncbi:hypothetical protein DFJ43DRAFT_1152580 [Lentinula guzmanii]|uniref:Acyl-CoA thioesterase-like N-terminal HotDog domain-containing protein n=1 Tax=Lentinula guzmanii TaxID=2804957 RepID=A0AA38N1C8_9AGAR|nr:hypothetical protein DFJ43DRAFT_1152580 [Lentinula guzmanii]
MLLSEAINVTKKSGSGDADVYIGEMDPEWCIGVVPGGGYALGQIVESCVQKQYSSPHPDPIQATAHFLNSPSASAFEVHIRLLKTGKNFTNLEAVLLQDSVTKILSHLIFGVLEPLPSRGATFEKKSKGCDISFLPPSPYARRLPLYHHPALHLELLFPLDSISVLGLSLLMSRGSLHETRLVVLIEVVRKTWVEVPLSLGFGVDLGINQ